MAWGMRNTLTMSNAIEGRRSIRYAMSPASGTTPRSPSESCEAAALVPHPTHTHPPHSHEFPNDIQ